MILVSGVCSFVYEVMWVRLLGHLIGGSTYAFATMLASFLIGITLGSSVAARIATNTRRAIIGFGTAQLGIAGLSVAAFSSISWIAFAMREQLAVPEATGAIVILTMVTLLPAALCIGATFPFAVRIMARGSEDASSASARVYSWNTVGSIVGSILAGFVLLPMLQFAGTLELAVGLNLLLAAFSSILLQKHESESATSSQPWIPRVIGGLGVVGLVLLIFLAPGEPWAVLLRMPVATNPNSGRVIYYAVGRGATVLLVEENGRYRLRTNGLPESAIGLRGDATGRLVIATWLGNLPGLLRPEAESMLVVGLGGGVMIEHVPPTIKKISVVELEAEVVEANRIAASVRARDPLSDPRVSVTVNDARTALMISGREFDSIISQPSHPWTAGSSHLYTRDFFQLASDHMTDEGVFVQWMGMGFVDRDLFRILVATLADVFPYIQVYAPGNNAFLFVGSKRPFEPLESAAEAIRLSRDHYELIGITEPEDVLAAMLLDDAGSRRFSEGAEISTDDFNILQTRSPNVRGRGIAGLQHALKIVGELDALRPPPAHIDALALVRRLSEKGRGFRAVPIAKSLPNLDDRKIAELIIALESPTKMSIARLHQLMREHPSNRELRAASLRLKLPSNGKRWTSIPSLIGPLGTIEKRIVAASRLVNEADWDGLAALDAKLAEVTTSNPNHRLAVQFRIAWRVAKGEPGGAREALGMLDRLVGGNADLRVLLRRTQLGDLAGDSGVVLSSTLAALDRAKRLSPSRLLKVKARVMRVPDEPPFQEMRAEALEKIQRRIDQGSSTRSGNSR
jgi:predicted membrane-bound spermidine synthase